MVEAIFIEVTQPLPEEAVAKSTYRIEGSAKLLGALGAPPFLYARIQHKEWNKPEALEEVDYERAWPVPITGDFAIDFKPEEKGEYDVGIISTPAALALPVVGVVPVLAESDLMHVSVGEEPSAEFRFSEVVIDGNTITLSNHDADSQLRLQKNTDEYLDVSASFEWVGPAKTIEITVQAGHKGVFGFSSKTDAYKQTIELPESPDTPYGGSTEEAIRVPLTGAAGLSDGAIEIVAKIPGESDYITHIWNVFRTKEEVVSFRFSEINIDGNSVLLGNHDADSGLRLEKTTSDYLEIIPAFEWQGPAKAATVSIKAGYRDWLGGFTPKTGAYTRSIQFPESTEEIYEAELDSPIKVPLVAAGDLDDGAIEVVLKISGESDYISQIWNVFITKVPGEEEQQTLEIDITPSGSGYVTTDPEPESGPSKWYNGSTGKFVYGTRVQVTAHPAEGYEFDHWSDEIEGGVSYVNPAYVADTMTEHRAVKAHFREIEGEEIPPDADIRNIDLKVASGSYEAGDRVSYSLEFEYKGRAQSGQLTLYLGTGTYPSFSTKVTFDSVAVDFERNMDWTKDSISGSFELPASVVAGQTYSVRGKLEALEDTTQETDTDWGVITIPSEEAEVPDADIQDFDLKVTAGEYEIGDYVNFSIEYEYRGKAQQGQLVLYIGTGVYPTFTTKKTYSAMPISFEEAMDWTKETISGTFVIPSGLAAGQTYSMRGKLETLEDTTQEIDTDWSVITIPSAGPPDADIQNFDLIIAKGTYKPGDTISFRLDYEYKGKAQSGKFTLSYGTGVYPTFITKVTHAPMGISFAEAMGWTKRSITGTFVLSSSVQEGQTYNVRGKLETTDDTTQETDTDWGIIDVAKSTVSFKVAITGVPAFGSYDKWWAYYFDPGINDFVNCGKWYNSYDKIPFDDVKPGGYLAVFLYKDGNTSSQYSSPTFQPSDGGSYTYDVQYNRVY